MSDFETVARPYSKAIFELASEQNNLQFWADTLQLAALVSADDEMKALVSSPSIMNEQLSELFVSVIAAIDTSADISQEVKNLINLLTENDRLLALPEIAKGFEGLKQEAEGAVEVIVRSARKLTAKQEAQIMDNLKKRLGKKISISAEVDKSLIAGAIITAGDLVIDGTALGRLNKMTSLLNK